MFGRVHAELGEEVVAVVVSADGEELDPEDLRSYARERLAHDKVPRSIKLARRELPRTLIGKVARWKLTVDVTRRVR